MICYFIFGQLVSGMYNKENLSSKSNVKLLMYSALLIAISLGILHIFPVEFISTERTTFQLFLVISSILLLVILLFIRTVDIKYKFKKLSLI
jgi:NADH:ubiquinone oxidoreductase subunit 3 (subunit A)